MRFELALKAFLRTADVPIVAGGKRRHHHITELYEECRGLGLKIGPDDALDIRNVVALLEGANEEQGLRYFQDGKFEYSRSFLDSGCSREFASCY